MAYKVNLSIHDDIKKALRYMLDGWRQEQYRKANYSCFVTKKCNRTKNKAKNRTIHLDIHHMNISFEETIQIAHKRTDIKRHQYKYQYQPGEFDKVAQEVIRIHQEEVIAVCLEHNTHMYLHQKYGNNFSMEQLKEYKRTYGTRRYKAINGQKKSA